MAWGLIAQALGFGSIAAVMWRNMRNQSLGSQVTAAMVRFAWHSQLHTRSGLVVLIAGAVAYAAGSVIMARPFISRPLTLFIAVPVAAVAGMLALGVLALLVAALVSALAGSAGGGDSGGSGGKRRQDRQ